MPHGSYTIHVIKSHIHTSKYDQNKGLYTSIIHPQNKSSNANTKSPSVTIRASTQ